VSFRDKEICSASFCFVLFRFVSEEWNQSYTDAIFLMERKQITVSSGAVGVVGAVRFCSGRFAIDP